MDKSVVLFSSGLDSTVNLYEALSATDVVLALTFDYGQRAAKKEIQCAQTVTKALHVPHRVIDLPFFKDFTSTSLVNQEMNVPQNIAIDDEIETVQSASAVWVPNRNGIFLNIAAGFAEGLGANVVIPGFNIEEGQTFPDNTQQYLDSLSNAFAYSTANRIKAISFTTHLNKTQIALRGRELGVDFNMIWSCYYGEDQVCKACESCLRFHRATRAIL